MDDQPLSNAGQAVVTTFKAFYLRRTLAQTIAELLRTIEKTLVQFWKDYNTHNCIKNLAWVLSEVIKEYMKGIWTKTLKKCVHDFKVFAKNKEVANINKALVEMANKFNLGVYGDGIEEPLETDLINEELLELGKDHLRGKVGK